MAHNPQHCHDPSTPSPIWEGTSTGSIITIAGIETYITRPRNNQELTAVDPTKKDERSRVILFLTEGHSIYFLNAQLLADAFACQLHCDVIMPDQFHGRERVPAGQEPHFPKGKEEIPRPVAREENESAAEPATVPAPYYGGRPESKEEFESWIERHEPSVTDPLLTQVVRYIHQAYGEDVRIGGVGYCFGGRYVMRLMGAGVFDVGVVNHPSFFTLDEVRKLGSAKRLAIYAAETDDILPAEKRRATEDVLMEGGVTWMSTVFSATRHGFSVRGDLKVKEVRLAKERAFRGAVEWFRDWL